LSGLQLLNTCISWDFSSKLCPASKDWYYISQFSLFKYDVDVCHNVSCHS
jgi:hypothetical protein